MKPNIKEPAFWLAIVAVIVGSFLMSKQLVPAEGKVRALLEILDSVLVVVAAWFPSMKQPRKDPGVLS